MAIALLLALILILAGCILLFVSHPWWFPAGVAADAAAIDHDFHHAFWILGALFIAAQLLLVLFLLRAWRRKGASGFSRGDWRLEIAWTIAIAALFFWFHASGGHLWRNLRLHAAPSDSLQIEVTGAQFQWYFRYPGPDGKLGRVDAQKFAAPEEGNPLGLDPEDTAGKDDIVSAQLVLPVNRDVLLQLRSQDVIHSLFIPAMRFKQDAVPGSVIPMHLRPTSVGNYEIACAELCGLGHYRMRALVRVLSGADFAAWLKARSSQE
ncbi:MAG TPA: cytochrome C oxidase subunit II [Candidatus Angelobacter sp.]|jgi:cytochrome c oxidase subunit 2|nr:cytochrome C oxidase subunit II [Candidatus Angelobacter sp.]